MERNVFYEYLRAVEERLPIGDTVIVKGDLNVKGGI